MTTIKRKVSLLEYNTFGIDATAEYFAEYHSIAELRDILHDAKVQSLPVLPVGCGSNLLFTSDNFEGVVLRSGIRDINCVRENDEELILEAGSGLMWDDFVAYTVEKGFWGAENLSLVPGVVGAAAVQNIGAYGVEFKDIVQSVKTIERKSLEPRTLPVEACRYGYRSSIFKQKTHGQHIVTSVQFRLSKHPRPQLGYGHLEAAVRERGKVNLRNIRETIIGIRRSKLPDTRQTGSAGSFFLNPVISEERFREFLQKYPAMPHYTAESGKVKIPAAWLIEYCGWKGKRVGAAGVHEHQALVLVNHGGAKGQEILQLARDIQSSVSKQFDIRLDPEVEIIG